MTDNEIKELIEEYGNDLTSLAKKAYEAGYQDCLDNYGDGASQ